MTSRGQPNENYYVAQKAVRALGTNSIDSAARLCHSPSTAALKESLGVAATTCSYADLIGTDLVVFIGSNVAQNQPVMMKYLYHARKHGTKVAVVNPYREPAMENYWVPSNVESAVFGTKMTDRFFQVSVGGDIAFLNGALKHMVERDWVDRAFIEGFTDGFNETVAGLADQSWDALEAGAGTTRQEMLEFGRMLATARTAVLVWSMGVTQHSFGEDAVRAVVNVGLSRGFVGREKCGLMPIRGHSGVQGAPRWVRTPPRSPVAFPSRREGPAICLTFGVSKSPPRPVSARRRWSTPLSAAASMSWCPRAAISPKCCRARTMCAKLFERVPLRVHLDIVPSAQMLVEPAGTVVLLPVQTRYEMVGGVTETSTERRVIFSPEIPGPRVAEARPEWEVFMEMAEKGVSRRGPTGPFRRHGRDQGGNFPSGTQLCFGTDLGVRRGPVPVRRPDAVRGLAFPHTGRQSPLQHHKTSPPGCARRCVRGHHPTRPPVQQHGPGQS